jgi:putative ABC transport system permease protein
VQAFADDKPWPALRAVVERELPAATVTEQTGLPDDKGFLEIRGADTGLASTSASVGSTTMVSDDALPLGLIGVSQDDEARASAMLRQGGVVAFVSGAAPADGTEVRLVRHAFDPGTGQDGQTTRAAAPAAFIDVDNSWSGPGQVVSSAVAAQLGVTPETVSLAVTGADISEKQEQDVEAGLAAVVADSGLYVERGYQPDDATVIVELVLVVLGAVLMLGGTLTATFLALSDARPDLATLAAVGASPRMRRGVAAAYAVVVGGVGAVLGAAVGFIPGLAVTWPLTSQDGSTCVIVGSGSCEATGTKIGPFLDVPWLMVLALVVVLPVVTALVVGLFARSRLPLVARLD